MKVFILCSHLIYYAYASPKTSSLTVENGRSTRSLPAVDALITKLEQDRWESNEEPCLRTTMDMLRGVKNNTLWATWVWDSMQPPVGIFYGSTFHVGNYDQCLKIPWAASHPALQTQYCLVNFKTDTTVKDKEFEPFDSAVDFIQAVPHDTRRFSEQVFGVCLPASCSPTSITKISQNMLRLTHIPEGAFYVDPRDCVKVMESVEYSRGFYVFWAVVGILIATAVYSTLANKDDIKPTALGTITKSFCMKRNYDALFKVNRDEIKVMNGIRFLTALSVVVAHEGFYTLLSPTINGLDMDKSMTTFVGKSIMHMDIIVDTFFAMSGLLLVRNLMQRNQKNVLYTLLKRYLRLIGPFALCTLGQISVAPYVDHGPFYNKYNRLETVVCEKNWWRNLLMINNNLETLCHPVGWYLSVDFQLAILATFLFWIFRRNRRLGVIAFVGIAVGLTLKLGWTVYGMQLHIVPFNVKSFYKIRKYTALNYIYYDTWSRAGSYMVGMLMGYVVFKYKSAEYRNLINKQWSITITCVSLATMLVVCCIGAIFSWRPYVPLEAAVVVATNRVFWAIGVCCFIGACEYGTVPLISDLLSWPGFVPLSKLSYGLYMLHPFIYQKQKFAMRNSAMFGPYIMTINIIGVAVLGCIGSLVLYLILEGPSINISNNLFTEKSKLSQQNQEMKEANGMSEPLHQNEQKNKVL